MAHLSKIFKQQPVDIPNRSGMDLSFENVVSMTTGTLIPVLVEEVLPNETYSLGYMCEAQLPPMATEFYGRIDMRLEAFFVPNRILWGGWQDFMTMPVYNPFSPEVFRPSYLPGYLRTGDVSTAAQHYFETADYLTTISDEPFFGPTSLADYLGLKTSIDEETAIANDLYVYFPNILSFLAYHKIYDDWYRNPNVTLPLFTRPKNLAPISGAEVFPNVSFLPYVSQLSVTATTNNVVAVAGNLVERSEGGYLMDLSASCFFLGNSTSFQAGLYPHIFSLHQRCWEKDYYTTAAFYPQASTSPLLF